MGPTGPAVHGAAGVRVGSKTEQVRRSRAEEGETSDGWVQVAAGRRALWARGERAGQAAAWAECGERVGLLRAKQAETECGAGSGWLG